MKKNVGARCRCPLSSSAAWRKDHTDACSIVDLIKAGESQELMVIPQATIVGRIKGTSGSDLKNLNYHRQASLEESRKMYEAFQAALRDVATDLLAPKQAAKGWTRPSEKLVEPMQLFRSG